MGKGQARTGWLQRHQRKGVSEEVSRAAEAEQQEMGHLVLVTKRSLVTLASWALSLENGVWDVLQETAEDRSEKNKVHMTFFPLKLLILELFQHSQMWKG